MNDSIRLLPFEVLRTARPPWFLEHVHAGEMWKRGYTGEGAVVAVLDTGCAPHPFIRNSIIGGMNFTEENRANKSDYSDNNGHGTHVSGIIAAQYNRSNGMSGVSPGAKLLELKVLNSDGTGEIGPILKAIYMAVNWRGRNGRRVNVISMSFGTDIDYPELERAVNYAAKNDILVVTAAGNEGDGKRGTSEVTYPGFYGSVLQVGASNIRDEPALFSNTNRNLDIVAPGVDILSLGLSGSYAVMSGTSMAAPMVAGGVSLIISYYIREMGRYPSREEILRMLKKNTRHLNYSRSEVGYGLMDMDYFKNDGKH